MGRSASQFSDPRPMIRSDSARGTLRKRLTSENGDGSMRRVILESMDGGLGLIQIVDAALAEAVRKSGAWLACRPGCCECCMGPFPFSEADAARLRDGLAELESRDAGRAGRI